MTGSMHSAGSGRGFTYIGLLIFLALLSLAAAATLQLGSVAQQRSDEAELLFIGSQFTAALSSYYAATPVGQNRFPQKVEDLLRDPRYPGVRRHLRRVYVDPMTGNSQWDLIAAPDSGFMGVSSLSSRAPLKVAGFNAAYADFADKKKYSEWQFIALPAGYTPPPTAAAPGSSPTSPRPPK